MKQPEPASMVRRARNHAFLTIHKSLYHDTGYGWALKLDRPSRPYCSESVAAPERALQSFTLCLCYSQ